MKNNKSILKYLFLAVSFGFLSTTGATASGISMSDSDVVKLIKLDDQVYARSHVVSFIEKNNIPKQDVINLYYSILNSHQEKDINNGVDWGKDSKNRFSLFIDSDSKEILDISVIGKKNVN